MARLQFKYSQCNENCTTDCAHCKGKPDTIILLRNIIDAFCESESHRDLVIERLMRRIIEPLQRTNQRLAESLAREDTRHEAIESIEIRARELAQERAALYKSIIERVRLELSDERWSAEAVNKVLSSASGD